MQEFYQSSIVGKTDHVIVFCLHYKISMPSGGAENRAWWDTILTSEYLKIP